MPANCKVDPAHAGQIVPGELDGVEEGWLQPVTHGVAP